MTETSPHFFHLSPTCQARARLEEAEHYFLAGNLNEALAAAQQAWREHPGEADVFRVLAYLHMARGEYPPAAQAAYQAVTLDGANPASYATLAQVYLTFNMLPLADETLTAALPQFPNDPTLLTLSADVRFRRGREGSAVEQVTLALQQNPHDGYAKALLGGHHLRRKHYTAAQKLLTDAVVSYPQRWDYLRDLGVTLVHTGDYRQAQRVLAQSFRLNPLDARARQYFFLSLRLGATTPPSWHWVTLFFFYRNLGWAWFINLAGLLAALVGLIIALIQLVIINNATTTATTYVWLWWGLGVLLVGLVGILLTQGGIILHFRKHRSFDAYLSREAQAILGGE